MDDLIGKMKMPEEQIRLEFAIWLYQLTIPNYIRNF